jgi:hypothetical protein
MPGPALAGGVHEILVAPVSQDGAMPIVSSFYGIDIKLYFGDHSPPHFHVFYGEFSAVIAIQDLTVLAGGLPKRAMALVRECANLPRSELHTEWHSACNGIHPRRIDPLP